MLFHIIAGSGTVEECQEPTPCHRAEADVHFTSLEAAQAAYDDLLQRKILEPPFYRVGDTIVLSGDGWEDYCPAKVSGGKRTVLSVTDDGKAMFAILGSGDNWYSAWASPDPDKPLHATKFSE